MSPAANPLPCKKTMDKRKLRKRLNIMIERLTTHSVIVEGIKDKKSLKEIGIEAYTYEEAKKRKIMPPFLILTDLDEEGNRKCKELYDIFIIKGKVDTKTRKELSYILKIRTFNNIGEKIKQLLKELED